MTDAPEMLRRLRSGMDAMFDAASADVNGKPVEVAEAKASPLPTTFPFNHYRKDSLATDASGDLRTPTKTDLSGHGRSVMGASRLDNDPGQEPRYVRDTSDAFTDAEIEFMTGGKD